MEPRSELNHRIRVHCFSPYREILGEIPGIDMYPDRSAMLPGTIYLDGTSHTDVVEEHLASYLRPMGIGASEIRFVKGDTLFDGILSDPRERDRLFRELSNGKPTTLEAFSACADFDRFVASLNIDPVRLRTPMTSVMRMLDDKEAIRRLAHTLELDHVFPEHIFTYEKQETLARIREYRIQFPKLVVVKRPDLESGVGQLLITQDTTDEKISAYVHEYCTGHRPIIVEQGVFGIEGSVQWHVSPLGIEPRFFSRQYTHDGAHEGNVIAENGVSCLPHEWSLETRAKIVKCVWKTTEKFVDWIAKRGFIGPIGFDFIANPNSFYLLECNARTTAATYLESVRWQIEQRYSAHVCAAMKNAYPKRVQNWKQAVHALECEMEGLAFHPEFGSGVILANPRLFHLPSPKCLLIALQGSVQQAEYTLEKARHML